MLTYPACGAIIVRAFHYHMNEKQFLKLNHRRLAQIAIGASAIRNQGGSGLVEILRTYFEKEINLKMFVSSLSNEKRYKRFLNTHTENILKRFPKGAKSWGAARKGLNLFLRDIVYNKFFSQKYSIPADFEEFNYFIRFMEIPLDKDVASQIYRNSNAALPKWTNIKKLTPVINDLFQQQAYVLGRSQGIARVNLDLVYWRSKEK